MNELPSNVHEFWEKYSDPKDAQNELGKGGRKEREHLNAYIGTWGAYWKAYKAFNNFDSFTQNDYDKEVNELNALLKTYREKYVRKSNDETKRNKYCILHVRIKVVLQRMQTHLLPEIRKREQPGGDGVIESRSSSPASRFPKEKEESEESRGGGLFQSWSPQKRGLSTYPLPRSPFAVPKEKEEEELEVSSDSDLAVVAKSKGKQTRRFPSPPSPPPPSKKSFIIDLVDDDDDDDNDPPKTTGISKEKSIVLGSDDDEDEAPKKSKVVSRKRETVRKKESATTRFIRKVFGGDDGLRKQLKTAPNFPKGLSASDVVYDIKNWLDEYFAEGNEEWPSASQITQGVNAEKARLSNYKLDEGVFNAPLEIANNKKKPRIKSAITALGCVMCAAPAPGYECGANCKQPHIRYCGQECADAHWKEHNCRRH
jgi:hypothetical protein